MIAREIPALIKLLDDPDPEIFRQIEDKLFSYGEDIVPFLETEWEKSFNPVLQERLINLIHKIQFQNIKMDLDLWCSSGSFDLLRGILIVNRYQYPDLDEQRVINQIEEIKREVWMQMMYESSPSEKVRLLNHVFYTIYGFSGNTKNHKDPQNSYISQVLESKKGNQISLAILYSIVAQKLDIPIYGVNLPQHFILAYVDEENQTQYDNDVLFYINVFNRGYIFGRRDIDLFLKQLKIQPDRSFYEPCSNIDIIKRVLRNLISAYEELGSIEKVDEIKQLLAIISS